MFTHEHVTIDAFLEKIVVNKHVVIQEFMKLVHDPERTLFSETFVYR